MKKAERIGSFVAQLGSAPDSKLDPCYQGYFQCFNEQRYYEAHDVLEHLWLQGRDDNSDYYKGLIQMAGAFVHLQKQFLRPDHPKDGRRLRPAVRLFRLAAGNLMRYQPTHMAFDVASFCQMAEDLVTQIVESDFTRNPWDPSKPPQIALHSVS